MSIRIIVSSATWCPSQPFGAVAGDSISVSAGARSQLVPRCGTLGVDWASMVFVFSEEIRMERRRSLVFCVVCVVATLLAGCVSTSTYERLEADKNKEIATLQTDRLALQQQRAELRDQVEKLETQRAGLEEQKAQLERESVGLQTKLGLLANDKQALEQDKKGLEQEKRTLEQQRLL